MSKDNTNPTDNRPAYVSPQVIRLDDLSSGAGACSPGNSPAGGVNCFPTGNGAAVQNCARGNGAKVICGNGQGVGK